MKVKVTYLEMLAPNSRVAPPPGHVLSVVRAERPTVAYYRSRYNAVGKDWHWLSRRKMADADLARIIEDPAVEMHVLSVEDVPAGFVELDRRRAAEIEIVQFGLIPEFIGKGLGKWFLQWAIDKSWSYRPARLWLHTCSLDHPNALPNYLKAGFQVCNEEIIDREL